MKLLPTGKGAGAKPQGLRDRVAAYVIEKITTGEWATGYRIPSENELVATFGVSRMTVHHALRDLASQGFLARRSGSGTYVAEPSAYIAEYAHLDVIREIEDRGGVHRADVLTREIIQPPSPIATAFGAADTGLLFHAVIVHFEDEIPFELEDRWMDPAFIPDGMAIDLSHQTLFSRLMRIRPYRQGSEQVRAVSISAREEQLLAVPSGTPALEVLRKTWSAAGVVTVARMLRAGPNGAMNGCIRASSDF